MTVRLLEQELNEAFALLRRDGYEPELCSMAVPYYESLAMCGEPDFMYGDTTNVHGTVLCSFRSATL